jgi:EmrB/QacA subfamily drug resistance transporter
MDPVAHPGRRTSALAVLCASQLMVILDGTIVNVALPTIRHQLGFSASGLSWVVNGFFVAFAGLLLLFGRLGDVLGQRRVFVSGLVVFTLASVWCGLAGGPASLVSGRFVQGAGAAMASAVVLGMITRLFADRRSQARAFAVFAFVGSVGASVGVISGGLLTELLSWRWVFLVNVPLGLVLVPAALRILPDDGRTRSRGRVDVVGAVTGTGGLMLLVYAVTQVTVRGWSSLVVVLSLCLAAALLAGFVVRQRTAAEALVPPALFAVRRFSTANAVLFTMTVAGFSFQFLSALALQDQMGLTPLRTGLAYLPVTLSIAVASLGLSDRLAGRIGQERVLVSGLVLFVAGLLLLAALPGKPVFLTDAAPAFVLMGTGFGLAMPQVTGIAMASALPEYAGAASGVVNTTQQVGGALGLGVVSSVAALSGLAAGFLTAAAVLAVGAGFASRLVPRGAIAEPCLDS